ncbi:MAG: DUF6279 family lipoprotein [Methylophilus sp.]|nr:DUF6279 family lipoprotein [Methylophilus sp.]
MNTFYGNAPEVVRWWLDDYFDFTSPQKTVLDPALHRLHAWHRQQQLPEYIAILQDLKSAANKEQISSDEACQKIDRVKASMSALQLAFIPVIIEVAPLLSDQQLAYFKKKLSKRANKWKDEWWQESTEAQIDARFEKIEDFAEKVYGNLNAAQRTLIRKKLEDSHTQPSIAYDEMLRRNEDAYQIITTLHKTTLSDSQKTDLLKEGFLRLTDSPNPTYLQHAKQVTIRTCEIISHLHALTNATQKQHANAWFGKQITQLSNFRTVN